MLVRSIIVFITLWVVCSAMSVSMPGFKSKPRAQPLRCYNCACRNDPCPCSEIATVTDANAYCVIVRQDFGSMAFVDLEYLDQTSTRVHIREFPFVLVEESIKYNESTLRWNTTTNIVIYGCNWDLCNKPNLAPLLPNSLQMQLPDSWLNANVLGTGQPVRECHECPNAPQCGSTTFLDASRCPIKECNTTCFVLDLYDDPSTDRLCYQSRCLEPDEDGNFDDRHRVEIEGIVYAYEQNKVDVWEVDVYCRADDCSRPEMFNELREQLEYKVGDLQALFNETYDPAVPQRRCYSCTCYNKPNCPCNHTNLRPANLTYCVIIIETFGQEVNTFFQHVDRNSTRAYIRDFPYLLVEESILYSGRTGLWNTQTNIVVFGCNWDYCNEPSLVKYMPSGFQMRLSPAWLNRTVLSTGAPVRKCHECPDGPRCGSSSFLDLSQCPVKDCNATCIVSDTFDDPTKDEQCYQSYCAQPDSNDLLDPNRVELEGVLYLRNKPVKVEIWEADIYCRADDCSRPEIFTELRSNLSVTLGDLSVFDALLTTTASPPGTTSAGETTTASPPGTTSAPSNGHILGHCLGLIILSILLMMRWFH